MIRDAGMSEALEIHSRRSDTFVAMAIHYEFCCSDQGCALSFMQPLGSQAYLADVCLPYCLAQIPCMNGVDTVYLG
jgi:hypothetical protein